MAARRRREAEENKPRTSAPPEPTLEEWVELMDRAEAVSTGATVACPPDVHRFVLFGQTGSLETEKVRACVFAKALPCVFRELDVFRGEHLHPDYAAFRLLGVGLWEPSGAAAGPFDGCTRDPFGVCTLVDRLKRKVVVHCPDIVEYVDRESCHASRMQESDQFMNAGKRSIVAGRRNKWGEGPLGWTAARRALVRKQAALVDELPLDDLWFCGPARPRHVRATFSAAGFGAAEVAMIEARIAELDGAEGAERAELPGPRVAATREALRPRYEARLRRAKQLWARGAPALGAVEETARRAVRELAEDIARFGVGGGPGPWLGGRRLSMADAYWHAAAVRLVGFGLGGLLAPCGAYFEGLLGHVLLRQGSYLFAGRHAFPLAALEPYVLKHARAPRRARDRHAYLAIAAAGRSSRLEGALAAARYAATGSFVTLLLAAPAAWYGFYRLVGFWRLWWHGGYLLALYGAYRAGGRVVDYEVLKDAYAYREQMKALKVFEDDAGWDPNRSDSDEEDVAPAPLVRKSAKLRARAPAPAEPASDSDRE